MAESLALRVALATGAAAEEEVEATLAYSTDVPLFASGGAAAEHGLTQVEAPSSTAVKVIRKLARRVG